MKFLRTTYFIVSFAISYFATAQPFQLNFQTTQNKNSELTESTYNNYIFQESEGFIWISSIEGINRFDGYAIKNYGEDLGMKGKKIQSNFFEDKNKKLWFSTYYGLNYYERKTDSIKHVPIINDAEGYRVFYLDDYNNRLWLRINNKIFWVDINDVNNFGSLPSTTNGENFSVVTNKKEELVKIIACPWSKTKGLEIYEVKDTILKNYNQYLKDETDLKKAIILSDSLWLLLASKKLLLFDLENPSTAKVLKGFNNLRFWDVVKKDVTHLFISTKDSGLYYYNWREEKIVSKWQKNNKEGSLSTNQIGDLYIYDNYLWVNLPNEKGVEYAYLNNSIFENLFEQAPINSFSIKATAVVDDGTGKIWVGTEKNGVYVFSSSGELLRLYRNLFSDIRMSKVRQIQKNSNGQIFIITEDKVFLFEKHKMIVKEIRNLNSLMFRSVVSIFPNRTLLATIKGIKELIKDESGEYHISNCKEFNTEEDFKYTQFFQSSKKKLYVPYDDTALRIYDIKNGLRLDSTIDFDNKIYGFFESKKHKDLIWIATENGLAKIEEDTIKYIVHALNFQIQNQPFYSVTEDGLGDLWLTSNNGLWQYNPQKKTLVKYETIDGLPGNAFAMYNGAMLSSTGDIWLANNKGIVKFNPETVKPYPHSPKVWIEELKINYTKDYPGIRYEDTLNLDYKENNLSFKFNILDFYKPQQNNIQYRLLGHYNEWLTTKPDQLANFAQVPPGKYALEFRVEDGSMNHSSIVALPVYFNRSFWENPIFWFLIGSLFPILMIWEYIKGKRQQTKNVELKLQVVELEQKALRAQMNPHFLLNTLTSIKALLFENKAEQAANFFTKLSNLIDGVLDNSKKQHITLEKELETIKLYMELEAFRFSNKFSFEIEVSDKVEESFVRIPPLILQPFVENSILHGFKGIEHGEGKININVSRNGDFVICEITDNGVGRVAKNKTNKSNGIGTQNTKKRIELHHPENKLTFFDLKDEDNEAAGTKVRIKLFVPE